MIAVVRSAGATVANRALILAVQTPTGVLTDVDSAAYQIFDQTTELKEATPVQVWPTVVDNRDTIDVVAHRLSVGRYAAIWDSSAATLGRYFVRWYYTVTAGGPEETFDQEFELVSQPYMGPAYCTLYDLLNAGYKGSTTDGVAQKLIVQASKYIELYTGRRFYPLYKSITVNGTYGRALILGEPIVAVEGLNIDYSGSFASTNLRDVASYRIYNRHITQNLVSPDDRDNPRLEFLHGWTLDGGYDPGHSWEYDTRFAGGVHNVRVTGIFGYTEPDGSSTGSTPHLIRLACQMMCFKQQYPIGSVERANAVNEQRLKSEYTRDQGFIYFDPADGRASPIISHTADPEVDAILYGFRRPPSFGAA